MFFLRTTLEGQDYFKWGQGSFNWRQDYNKSEQGSYNPEQDYNKDKINIS